MLGFPNSGMDHFTKLYSDKTGKYDVEGVKFRTKKRATQFLKIYYKECTLQVNVSYNCCKDGNIEYVGADKILETTKLFSRHTTEAVWTDLLYNLLRNTAESQTDSKCSNMISSSRMCNLDVVITYAWEATP